MRILFIVGLASCFALCGCSCGSAPSQVCTNDMLRTGCSVGRCTISSPSAPLPPGAVASVTEVPLDPALGGDTLTPTLCKVDISAAPTQPIQLAITLDETAQKDDLLFAYADETATTVAASGPSDKRVVGIISSSGTYGASRRVAAWSIEGYLGADRNGATDTPSLLRNLSNNIFSAAYFNARHLYVGNGPRVLVFRNVLFPATPALPDAVLGQPDLSTPIPAVSAALFGSAAGVGSIWADEHHLAVSSGNRLLLWNQAPTASLVPADIVLGQSDFTTNSANPAGVSASSLNGAGQVDSDGTRLLVNDVANHRVLVWGTIPLTVGAPADSVIGQANMSAGAPYGGSLPLYLPYGACFAPNSGAWIGSTGGPGLAHVASTQNNNPVADYSVFGYLFAGNQPGEQVARAGHIQPLASGIAERDYGMMRVLAKRSQPGGPSTSDFVLGQPDATRMMPVQWGNGSLTNPSRVSASTFGSFPTLGGGGAMLLVPDDRRLLIWEKTPTYNFEPASSVIGQAGFTVNERNDYRSVSASSLAQPADVSTAGQTTAIVDRGNNRVLLFKTTDLVNQLPQAFAVVGQPDFKSFLANIATTSATTLSGPSSVALDGTHLVVADTENHRVLIWTALPTTGVGANIVLGQADFAGRRPNRGRGDSDLDGYSDADADGFFYPTSVQSDGTHLFVVDRANSRVLVWDTWPTTNGQPADRVLGQPNFKSVKANRGLGAFTIVADGFNFPTAALLDGTSLWVADTENNRVVRWDSVTTAPLVTTVLGQASTTSVANPNYVFTAGVYQGTPTDPPPPTTTTSVVRPRSLSKAVGKLFVSEVDSNRVHVFDGSSLQPVLVLGQPNDTSKQPNGNGVTASSLAEPMGLSSDGVRLWVADSRNHRVLGWDLSGLATGVPAAFVLGQASMQGNGFNGSSLATGGTSAQPRGLAMRDDELYVADTNNNRLLVMKASDPLAPPLRIIGQPNDTLALPNSGGSPNAHSMNAPRGVTLDANHVIVADTGNHRVLVLDRAAMATDAKVVLGQSDFTGGAANAGGVSLSTLRDPSSSCSDGVHFAVADTGNNRLLVWGAFPEVSRPADIVLGQSDGSGFLGNRGTASADGTTLSAPGACVWIDGALYVADTGNNRVLVWEQFPTANGAPADRVLGQTTDKLRNPATSVFDVDHLAGPAALAFDGANLYVVDRDLARVIAYRGKSGRKGMKAPDVLGGVGGPSLLRSSGGIATARGPLFTTKLFMSDTAANRVVVVTPYSRLQ